MNHLDIFLAPTLLEESRRELERERRRQWQIREARAEQRAARPSRFAMLTARLRPTVKPDPCRPLLEAC